MEDSKGFLTEAAEKIFNQYAIPFDKLKINSYDPVLTQKMFIEAVKMFSTGINSLLNQLCLISEEALGEMLAENEGKISEQDIQLLHMVQKATDEFVGFAIKNITEGFQQIEEVLGEKE